MTALNDDFLHQIARAWIENAKIEQEQYKKCAQIYPCTKETKTHRCSTCRNSCLNIIQHEHSTVTGCSVLLRPWHKTQQLVHLSQSLLERRVYSVIEIRAPMHNKKLDNMHKKSNCSHLVLLLPPTT